MLHYPKVMVRCVWLLWAGAVWAQHGAKPPVTLAVHVLVPCGTGAGERVKVEGASDRLCLDQKPFLTEADVQSAEIQINRKGRPMVFLTFHNEAAVRELQVTRKNIGNRVGIVLNGRVVATPVIAAASRLLYIDGNFTRPQADEIVMAFNHYLAAPK